MPRPLAALSLLAVLVLAPGAFPTPLAQEAGELAAHEVARVDGVPVSDEEFARYASEALARREPADVALQHLLSEAIVAHHARLRGVALGEDDLAAFVARLDARARAASSEGLGLAEQLEDPAQADELRAALRHLALQERLVQLELGLDAGETPDDVQMTAWLAARLAEAELVEQPLHEPLAATWAHGRFTREEVGRRILATLPDGERSELLSELIGMLLVERAAAQAGVLYTEAAAEAELAERDEAVRSNPRAGGVGYQQVLEQVEHRSLDELKASRRFRAEVLLRTLVERQWDERRLSELLQEQRAALERRLGAPATLESARPLLWREARARTYRQLFQDGRIARRW